MFRAFTELTDKGYFLVEEQNFGADWAVYTSDPDIVNNHAEFLVFLDPEARIYIINRLATILKKKVGESLSGTLAHCRATWSTRIRNNRPSCGDTGRKVLVFLESA